MPVARPARCSWTVDGAPSTHGLTSSESDKVYGLAHYSGIPEALRSKFEAEPLLPGFALGLYDKLLGPALLIVGITLLLGIATRVSLFVHGLIYISLTVGLILIKQDSGVAWLGIHVLLVAVALFHAKHNRCQLACKSL